MVFGSARLIVKYMTSAYCHISAVIMKENNGGELRGEREGRDYEREMHK
jgi:hypothetical protein